jgi:phenylpropionate dioxygenase-like ring-hydroxylating dioxygenase large terminal subunit
LRLDLDAGEKRAQVETLVKHQPSAALRPAASAITQLKDFWYIAAESRELKSRPLRKILLGDSLVLFRQADGSPAALADRCAHRNMALSRGRVQDGLIECPYHGWRYRGDGTCAHIPSLSPTGEPPVHIGIRSYPAAQSDGYVWIYLGSKKPSELPPRFPHFGEPQWTTFRMKTRFQAGAFSCLENFLDCPHTVYVHRGWFRSPHIKEVRARVTRSDGQIEVRFFAERDARSVVSRLLFPGGEPMVHTDRFLMPSTSRVDYAFGPDRHFIITSQCTPISEHETEVFTVISFRFGSIGPLVRLFFEPLARRIIRQDVKILRLQAEQLRRFGGGRFTFIESDLIGPHILRLWGEAPNSSNLKANLERIETRDVVLRF